MVSAALFPNNALRTLRPEPCLHRNIVWARVVPTAVWRWAQLSVPSYVSRGGRPLAPGREAGTALPRAAGQGSIAGATWSDGRRRLEACSAHRALGGGDSVVS